MNDQTQNVALPAYLQKRLQAFRIGQGTKQSYLIRDKLIGKTYDFEPWQFFVLEILPGCESFEKLASIFKDRFGHPITQEQMHELLVSVMDDNLLDKEDKEVFTHPLLAPIFESEKIAKKDGIAQKVEQADISKQTEPTKSESTDLPAGVQDAIDLDSRVVKKMWKIFDPRPALKLITPFLVPIKYFIYLIPVIVIAAIILIIKYRHIIIHDIEQLHAETSFFSYIVFSMFTVNLIVVLIKAVVAYNFRVTVSAFGIGIFLGFLPRFTLQSSHLRQLSRSERIWLHAAPLLTRLCLFSLGILIWFNARNMDSHLSQIGLMLTIICLFSFLFSANPLLKGDGYHLLSAFMNEPFLRAKSYIALLNKLSGASYKEADNNILITYALVTFIFIFLLIIAVTLIVSDYLKQIQLGGSGILLVTLLALYLFRLAFNQFARINEVYERSVQYDRWRKRVLPEVSADKESDQKEQTAAFSIYAKRVLLVTLLVTLFLPYPYEPSGKFIIFPNQKQMIATDISGIIEHVYFDGGEMVKKGTVIAQLQHNDFESQVKIYTAKIKEQEAVINELKSRPKPEEVKLAQNLLNTEITKSKFSEAKLKRTKDLYIENAVSFEELDAIEREHKVNLNQVEEKRAALELLKSGATKHQIDSAQEKLKSLIEERASYVDKISRSVIRMPFDGNILTLHLRQKINSFLEKGDPFAEIENAAQVIAEIEIPESDIAYITNGARVRLKPISYYNTPFQGTVTTINRGITEDEFGNVVKVIALIENESGELRTGMTGFAKIEGETIPVWKAFTLSIFRFINVEVWSWIP